MSTTRKEFLVQTGAVLSSAAILSNLARAEQEGLKIKLGVCDWSLRSKEPQSLELAKTIGLDGAQ